MQSFIPDSLRLLVAGLNHRTAPLALREAVDFSAAQAADATARFRQAFPQAELVILSTCNRMEFYVARPVSAEPSLETIARFIAEFHGIAPDALPSHLYHHEDRAMVEHLFSVASSLDSMVVGETQILSQVKQAYHHAHAPLSSAGKAAERLEGKDTGAGKVLHALFQRALAAAKDVHEKTGLSAGRLSVASVAVDLAASVFDRFDDKTVLCVGAGKMAALMLRHLAGLKPRQVLIANRSLERAQALAAQFRSEDPANAQRNPEARPLSQLDALLTEADILLTSTGAADEAGEPLITEARFKALLKPRRYRPIVMVDIAVPRDIDPAIAKLPNVYLYNIDDLQEVAAGNRSKRDQEIAAARALVHAHVEEFLRWFAARDVGPLIKALYEQSHAHARTELDAHFARNPDLSPEQRAQYERLTHRLVGKLLHGPVTQLTTHTEASTRPMLSAAIKRLFNLKDDDGAGEQPGESPDA